MPEAEGAGSDRGGVRPAAPAPSLAPAFALRMALFYTALFMVLGIKLPYLPVWLDWRGLTKAEIAAITAAPMFLRIFAGPLIAYAIDRWGRRRLAGIVLAGTLASAIPGWRAYRLSITDGLQPRA